jgi:hypothetical protein
VHPSTARASNWELLDHPLFSPDLTLNSYHLFTWHFSSNEEPIEGDKMLVNSQVAGFFDIAIQNLFPNATTGSFLVVTALRRMEIFFIIFFSHPHFFCQQLNGGYFVKSPHICIKFQKPCIVILYIIQATFVLM